MTLTSKAKALLRSLVAEHMRRVRAGQASIGLVPKDVSDAHGLGIPAADVQSVAEELVAAGLCAWGAEGRLELLKNALEKTL